MNDGAKIAKKGDFRLKTVGFFKKVDFFFCKVVGFEQKRTQLACDS